MDVVWGEPPKPVVPPAGPGEHQWEEQEVHLVDGWSVPFLCSKCGRRSRVTMPGYVLAQWDGYVLTPRLQGCAS